MSSMNTFNTCDLYIRAMMGAAERAICGAKGLGAVRKACVIDRLKSKYGTEINGNLGIVMVKLLESLFTVNQGDLIGQFNDVYGEAKGCLSSCMK